MNNLEKLASKHDLDCLKKRFCSDFKIPITIFDEDIFDWYVGFYQHGFKSKELWDKTCGIIDKMQYQSNINNFLDEYKTNREKLIQWILRNDKFLKFSQDPDFRNKYNIPREETKNVSKSNIYNEENVGKWFVSLDLKKANFQVLAKITGLLGMNDNEPVEKIYKDWIKDVCCPNSDMLWYMFNSKYTREVILGKCNPSRQIKMETWIIWNIWKNIDQKFKNNKLKLVQIGSDEIIAEILPGCNLYEFISDDFKKQIPCNTKLEVFNLREWIWETYNGSEVKIYERLPLISSIRFDMSHFKGIQKQYMPQIYENIFDIGPDKKERDLMFFLEKSMDIVKFTHRLNFKEIRS